MSARRWIQAIAPVAAAAGLGGLGARKAPEVYGRLRKPAWAPPAAAFAPAWSTLYVTIAIAGRRLAERGDRTSTGLHLTQLALNAAWPATFFGRRDKRASLVVIGALDAVLATEIVRAARDDRGTAALLTPYLAWTLYATALNASVSDPAQ